MSRLARSSTRMQQDIPVLATSSSRIGWDWQRTAFEPGLTVRPDRPTRWVAALVDSVAAGGNVAVSAVDGPICMSRNRRVTFPPARSTSARVRAGVLAYAAGDALGVPWEGWPPSAISWEAIDRLPRRGDWPAGALDTLDGPGWPSTWPPPNVIPVAAVAPRTKTLWCRLAFVAHES